MNLRRYGIIHAKERHMNNVKLPQKHEIPVVGERIRVQEADVKGNQKLNIIDCIVREEYKDLIKVEVIKKIDSKISENKIYTYSECFRKSDFRCGFLNYSNIEGGE